MLKDVVVVEGGSRCEEIIAHDPRKSGCLALEGDFFLQRRHVVGCVSQ